MPSIQFWAVGRSERLWVWVCLRKSKREERIRERAQRKWSPIDTLGAAAPPLPHAHSISPSETGVKRVALLGRTVDSLVAIFHYLHNFTLVVGKSITTSVWILVVKTIKKLAQNIDWPCRWRVKSDSSSGREIFLLRIHSIHSIGAVKHRMRIHKSRTKFCQP